jgi:hypothetical protein
MPRDFRNKHELNWGAGDLTTTVKKKKQTN